jgi:hypothetical protein
MSISFFPEQPGYTHFMEHSGSSSRIIILYCNHLFVHYSPEVALLETDLFTLIHKIIAAKVALELTYQ